MASSNREPIRSFARVLEPGVGATSSVSSPPVIHGDNKTDPPGGTSQGFTSNEVVQTLVLPEYQIAVTFLTMAVLLFFTITR